MSADPATFAEMSQIDISVVRPFLLGTEGYSEGKITDEIFALKFFVDSLGERNVLPVVTELGSTGRHDEILPWLQSMSSPNENAGEHQAVTQQHRKSSDEEAAKNKKSSGGVFGWLFKGKDSDKDKDKEKEREREREKEREKEREREREREREKAKEREREKEKEKKKEKTKHEKPGSEERHRKRGHSSTGGHTDPNSHDPSNRNESERNSDSFRDPISSYEGRPAVEHSSPETQDNVSGGGSSRPATYNSHGGLPFNPKFTELEAQMMGQYNFQSTANRGYSTQAEDAAQSSARRDDDFDAIFNEFVSRAKAEQ